MSVLFITADDIARLKTQLRRDEGVVHKIYPDSKGIMTCGVGRNMQDPGLADDEIEYLLNNDVNHRIAAIRAFFPWTVTLDVCRFMVLVNMAFMGVEKLAGFKHMLTAMQLGDWESAAVELLDSQYAKDVGPRADRLAQQLRTGKWQ